MWHLRRFKIKFYSQINAHTHMKGTIMDVKKIRAIAEVFSEHKLYELILEENGEKLTLKHPSGKVAELEQVLSTAAQLRVPVVSVEGVGMNQSVAASTPIAALANMPYTAPTQYTAQSERAQSPEQTAQSPDGIIITSPMVGVYYASPSPEQPTFAAVGQSVREGDVLCIVEAMKLMNEITAEQSGVIVEIYCENGALVEFGQKLFKLRAE